MHFYVYNFIFKPFNRMINW